MEPVKVSLGITDHAYTEVTAILKGDLKEGDDVIIRSVMPKNQAPGTIRHVRIWQLEITPWDRYPLPTNSEPRDLPPRRAPSSVWKTPTSITNLAKHGCMRCAV